jgi:hypothetical protein
MIPGIFKSTPESPPPKITIVLFTRRMFYVIPLLFEDKERGASRFNSIVLIRAESSDDELSVPLLTSASHPKFQRGIDKENHGDGLR